MNTDDYIIDANGSWSSPHEALEWNGHIAFAVIWAMAMFCIAIHRTQVRAARKATRVAPA